MYGIAREMFQIFEKNRKNGPDCQKSGPFLAPLDEGVTKDIVHPVYEDSVNALLIFRKRSLAAAQLLPQSHGKFRPAARFTLHCNLSLHHFNYMFHNCKAKPCSA